MHDQPSDHFRPEDASVLGSLGPGVSPGVRTVPRPGRRREEERVRLARRIRAEYEEMPGLRLSVRQAARLFALDGSCCGRLLDECVREGWLCSKPGGVYALRSAAP